MTPGRLGLLLVLGALGACGGARTPTPPPPCTVTGVQAGDESRLLCEGLGAVQLVPFVDWTIDGMTDDMEAGGCVDGFAARANDDAFTLTVCRLPSASVTDASSYARSAAGSMRSGLVGELGGTASDPVLETLEDGSVLASFQHRARVHEVDVVTDLVLALTVREDRAFFRILSSSTGVDAFSDEAHETLLDYAAAFEPLGAQH